MKKLYLKILFLTIPFLTFIHAKSQAIIEIEPLFEYPVAPEELESLQDKSDYLVQHFWDAFDFKSKNAVDQNALNDAFRVYTTPLRWSNQEKTFPAVDKLISVISKNPTLLIQFTKAAEENLYGPRAQFWVDDIYIKFINALLKNNKVPDNIKRKYRNQANALENSRLESKMPEFSFTNAKGENINYFPMSTPTLIIFGDPSDTDWRLNRLRMETNSDLNSAIDKGKVNIIYIVPAEINGWQTEIKNYPSKWTIGQKTGMADIVDIRVNPSCYVIASDGNIKIKNAPVLTAVQILLDQVSN